MEIAIGIFFVIVVVSGARALQVHRRKEKASRVQSGGGSRDTESSQSRR